MVRPTKKRDAQTLVNEQVRKWRMERQNDSSESRVQTPWPIVTISREFGSLGATIGEEASGKLGFTFWDQEILHVIAEEIGVQQSLLETLDEHVRGRIEDFVSEQILGTKTTVSSYVAQLFRVIRSFAENGGAIVVGRGSQFIVDPDIALRVRVVCSRDARIAGYAERQNISIEKAAREVDANENERQEFYRRYFKREVNDATAYDLVINTEFLSLTSSVDLIIEAYRSKFGRLPSTELFPTKKPELNIASPG